MNVREYYSTRKELVDRAVEEFLKREGLDDISPTPFGGKRLRAVLCLLVCEALGGKPEQALDAAIAVELVHAASLDVDDIVDLDVLRRGKPATWILKGIVKTAVGSHALVSASLNLVQKYGYDAVKLFSDAYMKMVKGEIKDLKEASLYETIIAAKTASLWSVAAALGALAAGKRDYVNLARNYGLATGMAFQIADDIVDTVKLVEKMELSKLLQPSVMAFIGYLGLETLLRNPLKLLMKGIEGIKAEVRDIAMRKLDQWIRCAQGYAAQFPDSPHKQLLIDFPALSVDMMFKEAGWK